MLYYYNNNNSSRRTKKSKLMGCAVASYRRLNDNKQQQYGALVVVATALRRGVDFLEIAFLFYTTRAARPAQTEMQWFKKKIYTSKWWWIQKRIFYIFHVKVVTSLRIVHHQNGVGARIDDACTIDKPRYSIIHKRIIIWRCCCSRSLLQPPASSNPTRTTATTFQNLKKKKLMFSWNSIMLGAQCAVCCSCVRLRRHPVTTLEPVPPPAATDESSMTRWIFCRIRIRIRKRVFFKV